MGEVLWRGGNSWSPTAALGAADAATSGSAATWSGRTESVGRLYGEDAVEGADSVSASSAWEWIFAWGECDDAG